MIQIKNWQRFQRYKRAGVPWIKLHTKLLNDPEWFALKGEDAKILMMLWLIAAESNDGTLPCLEKLTFRLRVSKSVLESTVSRLSHFIDNSFTDDSQHDVNEVFSEAEGEGEFLIKKLKERERQKYAVLLIKWINEKGDKSFLENTTNLLFAVNRLDEYEEHFGSLDGAFKALCLMISRQIVKWEHDPKMNEFIRPETLLNKTKCASYMGGK